MDCKAPGVPFRVLLPFTVSRSQVTDPCNSELPLIVTADDGACTTAKSDTPPFRVTLPDATFTVSRSGFVEAPADPSRTRSDPSVRITGPATCRLAPPLIVNLVRLYTDG